jgi:hypothetical protein
MKIQNSTLKALKSGKVDPMVLASLKMYVNKEGVNVSARQMRKVKRSLLRSAKIIAKSRT